MVRKGPLALAAVLALFARAASAQWRTEPLVVPLDRPALDVVAGDLTLGTGADDLLVVDQARREAWTRRHHALLAPLASSFPIAQLSSERALRAGYLSQNGTDGLADVASHYATGGLGTPPSRVDVVFGSAPGSVASFQLPSRTDSGGPAEGGPPYVVSFLRLLAKPQRSDAMALPYCLDDVCSAVFLVDVGAGASPAATTRVLAAPDLEPMEVQPEAFPAWISTTAVAHGLDDVAIGSFGAVLLYAHRSIPAASPPTLADLDLTDPIVVGTTRHFGPAPGWLPPSIPRFSEVRGVATLDVDLDGIPDLVFAMSTPSGLTPLLGNLVWVKGTGAPADFADPTISTWNDLGLTLGLPDPMTVRPLRGASPAVAVWDRTLQEVLVVTAVPAEGRLAVWRAPAPGAHAKDIRLADVVGSSAQDLVVVMDDGVSPGTVLVYPDLGRAPPVVSWAPGNPGVPARGVPHAMAVAVEPGGPGSVAVEWISGVSTSAPVGTGLTHVFAPDCSVPPPPLVVTVRATDDTGLWGELSATLPLDALQPTIALRGSAGWLLVPPGGTTAVIEATAATGCGAASFGGSAWPAAATLTDAVGPTWLRRTVVIPEAAYPELLAQTFLVSLVSSDPGVADPVRWLPIDLDATRLVEASQVLDRASLAVGEVAILHTRLRSKVGVRLPDVRVATRLSGLEPAGAPTVSGAALVSAAAVPSSESGAASLELVLDGLPPAGGDVTIVLPVRATTARGRSAVEVRSPAGHLLTPYGTAPARPAPLPGCGCGTGATPGGLALVLLAAALRPRRRGGNPH